jgi:uncharacterized protein
LTLYIDSSALLKAYLDERDTAEAHRVLNSDENWTSVRLTLVEVRRVLAREYVDGELRAAYDQFARDWRTMNVIEVDSAVCERAAEIAEVTGVRTLDAVHLAAAQRAGAPRVAIATFDLRQAQAARSLGWTVLGS